MNNNNNKTFIYARGGNASIEKQLEELNKYVKNNNMEVVATYTDNTEERKFQQSKMLSNLSIADYILVYNFDRLTRNGNMMSDLLELFDREKVKVISMSDSVEE